MYICVITLLIMCCHLVSFTNSISYEVSRLGNFWNDISKINVYIHLIRTACLSVTNNHFSIVYEIGMTDLDAIPIYPNTPANEDVFHAITTLVNYLKSHIVHLTSLLLHCLTVVREITDSSTFSTSVSKGEIDMRSSKKEEETVIILLKIKIESNRR